MDKMNGVRIDLVLTDMLMPEVRVSRARRGAERRGGRAC
jgi:hypothetical protein